MSEIETLTLMDRVANPFREVRVPELTSFTRVLFQDKFFQVIKDKFFVVLTEVPKDILDCYVPIIISIQA